jgi:hypothetical protein
MKNASNTEINASLQVIEREIEFSLHDDKLLYDPSAFLDVAVGHLECLEAHVNCATEQVFETVFDFISDIEEKNDEGYLYSIDKHSIGGTWRLQFLGRRNSVPPQQCH